MKSSTRLDSATFQLTPTRTRCDLILSANGKSEKIASGLLNPFLAHLKTAQEQMARGGYSIILEPDPRSDRTWFTKGTMERFVRFVSTPEILERVYTIESEILQIEEAIVIQGNSDMGPNVVDDKQGKPTKPTESATEGSKINGASKPLLDGNEEKAIVLYKPDAKSLEANGHMMSEENSKAQLLKVLETRKTMLQKEQGMAFARAVAAGFDIDRLSPLISFANSFGASRLMDACIKFKELWKRKHESGQWLEIEAAEALSSRADFSPSMNASGIILTNMTDKQTESREALSESQSEPSPTNKGNASADGNTRTPMMYQSPPGHQEYLQGQYPHHVYPPWPINSPPGALPVFQGYPMQGMPYYQNYAGSSPFFHPHYPVTEDSRPGDGKKMGGKRHSMDSGDNSMEPEAWESNASETRTPDDAESEQEASEDLRKAGRSGKKKSSVVVIRNINYIASKRHNSSGSETDSRSDSESGEDGDSQAINPEIKHKKSPRSSRSKGKHLNFGDQSNTSAKTVSPEADGHWQAFQNLLLRDADGDKHHADQSLFTLERETKQKRQQNKVGDDPLIAQGWNKNEIRENGATDIDRVGGRINRMSRASNDELLTSRGDSLSGDGHLNVQATELDGGRNGYRRPGSDDFIVYGQKGQTHSNAYSDPLAAGGFDNTKMSYDKSSSNNLDGDSYIVTLRSTSMDAVGKEGRSAVDMDSEFPSSNRKAENLSNRVADYEPDVLNLVPKRETENEPAGYDPASEYEMQVHAGRVPAVNKKKEMVTDVKQGTKRLDNDRKPKVTPDRKTGGPIRKGKPSKLSPLDEARARAEKLRSYKADLQKLKKEKEEEAIKRIETLKLERQKRIAARGNNSNTAAQSSLPSQQTRKLLPTKMSPSSQKGSKFSDSDPGPSSPLQRFSIRTASIGSNDSNSAAKPSRLNGINHSAGNRLSQSVPSLNKLKKENSEATHDKKVSMARIRRLSEPKMSISNHSSSFKTRSTEPALKAKLTNETESKKKISNETDSKKKVSNENDSKRKISNETDSKKKVNETDSKKKISAIMNLDKSKAATLPELKIRTPKGPGATIGNSLAKEMTQSVNCSSVSDVACASMEKITAKVSHHNELDDNPVVEKTVVMLECEKPSIRTGPVSQDNLCDRRTYSKHKMEGKTDIPSEYSATNALNPQIKVSGVNREPIKRQSQGQLSSREVTVNGADQEAQNFSSPTTTEKLYKAPHARVSSFEDPCTRISEHGKATPSNLESAASGTETAKAYVPDHGNALLEKIPEALEKPEAKKSSKGLRLFLKFGRKNQSPATDEHNDESDNTSATGSEANDVGTNTTPHNEAVPTLKNLISQDETPTASKTQKSSRAFSLLSPFRSKNSEKRTA
ncbi:COP1-interacting protein 7-like isoform X1 [Cucurbita pepo subsp. pepo]|uniref:COP1-interacting protein 7-like isoform X1 n=1 Tax=Cucurbita pepo subsp. pepo TaxID=3664 RepID=UPI000C9D8EA5|nr:COP1-interacting protein 7-like isoform X1 [Cucurbita pepo subsp. pepo]